MCTNCPTLSSRGGISRNMVRLLESGLGEGVEEDHTILSKWSRLIKALPCMSILSRKTRALWGPIGRTFYDLPVRVNLNIW